MDLRHTLVRRVASNHDCAAVMMAMVANRKIKLDQLDLWVKLQGYYYFLSGEERMELDMRFDNLTERFNVSPGVYEEGIPILIEQGFFKVKGPNNAVPMKAGEVIEALGQRAADRERVAS